MVISLRSRSRKSLRSTVEPPSLPTDVLIEILKRLPLKSLVRFTCICKSWYSLLKSPTFISTLATFNFRKTQKFLLFKDSIDIHNKSSCTKFTVYNPNTLSKTSNLECPIGRNHYVVGSADGLVCLFEFYSLDPVSTPLYLWNPSIRKAVVVPVPPSGVLEFTSGGFPKLIFGVGFDSCSNSYKVVRVAYFNGGTNGTTFHADVYCVDDDEWRKLGVTVVPHKITTIRWRGVCLNGVVHWICNLDVNVNSDANDQICRLILTLKLGNDEFSAIELPNELVESPNHTLKVAMVPRGGKEVLGVIHNLKNAISLWVMENSAGKEPWVKLFSVNFGTLIKNDTNVLILSDHDVVVQTLSDGWVSYNHRQQQIQHLRTTLPQGLDYVDTYVESLILVGQRRRVLHGKEVQQKYPRRRIARGRRGARRVSAA